MLGHQGVVLFERIRKSGFIGGGMSLGMGFELSESPFHAQSLSLLLPAYLNIETLKLLLQHHVCVNTSMSVID